MRCLAGADSFRRQAIKQPGQDNHDRAGTATGQEGETKGQFAHRNNQQQANRPKGRQHESELDK